MTVEVRFDADSPDDLAVLDAHCIAHGTNRKEVMNKLLRRFVDDQVHGATLICRVKRINPLEVDSERK